MTDHIAAPPLPSMPAPRPRRRVGPISSDERQRKMERDFITINRSISELVSRFGTFPVFRTLCLKIENDAKGDAFCPICRELAADLESALTALESELASHRPDLVEAQTAES